MSESALKVFHELTSAGLLASDAATQYSEEMASGADALLEKLVVEKVITAYQSDKFKKGLASDICFGDYIVITELGRGGMGTVLLARHRVMDRKVAIKILPVTALESASAVARFYQEVKVAGKLTHNNIVHAYDAGEHRGFHYLVMEYVDGHDLAQVVNEIGALPLSLAIDYLKQAAMGLEYAHGQKVVHRDIKPSNLLLDKQGVVKVLDMGLARVGTGDLEEQSLHLTTTGQVMGTVEFMSPEQAEDTRLADARSDIYSLGCTFYRLLANRGPYSRDTVVKTILAHRGDPIPKLPVQGDPDFGKAQIVFEKMVAKKPDDRYQTVTALIQDLERIGDGSSFNLQTGLADDSITKAPGGNGAPIAPSNSGTPSAPTVERQPVIVPDQVPGSSAFQDQNFPKTAIAVRITDETAQSAISTFNQQYDSVSSRSDLDGRASIIDLSDNSTAHIAPEGNLSTSSYVNQPAETSEVFYIGDPQGARGLPWFVASIVILIISLIPPIAIAGAIGGLAIMFMTNRNMEQISTGKRTGGTRMLWLAKMVSILAIVAGFIFFTVFLNSW